MRISFGECAFYIESAYLNINKQNYRDILIIPRNKIIPVASKTNITEIPCGEK